MAYSNINKPNEYFNTVLYTGNGATDHAITGVGFQPDFTWIKRRSGAAEHKVNDVVRGAGLELATDTTGAELDRTYFLSFDTDGFTVNGTVSNYNGNGDTYASWNWLSGGTASSNTDGALASTVSANQTSGFSIVKVTGTSNGATTIGHGLGVAPKMIIKKTTSTTTNWPVYHASVGASQVAELNLTSAFSGSSQWGSTAPTTTVFTNYTNIGYTEIFYCFADVKGFSKFGSYTGNGSADGTFVYTGFKPAFVIFKSSSLGTTNWQLLDNKRNTFNPQNNHLRPNSSVAEFTNYPVDFLSNGFKFRNTDSDNNQSGETYIYMAFAEQPFVTSTTNGSIPATAR